MRVKRFLANAQLLRQIIHGHAPESVAEKMRPRSIDNSLPVRIALSASQPRLGRPFHIASTVITMRKLIQYIWFPQSTPAILMYFSAGRTSPQRIGLPGWNALSATRW
jgi:hypothetical protein